MTSIHPLLCQVEAAVGDSMCGAGGLAEMPSKEADAHMLSTLMQVQDFLRTHRYALLSCAAQPHPHPHCP